VPVHGKLGGPDNSYQEREEAQPFLGLLLTMKGIPGVHMYTNVQLYDQDGSTWNAFVASMPGATNYHQYGWRRVVERTFGHNAYYLTATDANNDIQAILPIVHMKSRLFGNFLVSLPFFNYGGILGKNDEAIDVLLAESHRLLKRLGAQWLELRHVDVPGTELQTRKHKVTMILPLEKDEEVQWKRLDPKVRNQVRKAEKSGLTSVSGQVELLDGFYDVFSRNMRDLGTPVYDRTFFGNMLEEFPDTSRLLSVFHGKRTIAAGLLTWFGDTLEVPWASSVREYREKCPNNLLYWEAIKFAVSNEMKNFDFGRSTPDEGTYHFKKQWGAVPVQLNWQYVKNECTPLPELSPSNRKYRMAIKLWQLLPVAMTRILGPRIVKSIP
jgi:serine/alanine adding enzyme